jgi:hypothetical protein
MAKRKPTKKAKAKTAKAKPAPKSAKQTKPAPKSAKKATPTAKRAAKKPAAKPSRHPVVVTPAPVPLPMPVVVAPPPVVVAPGPIAAIPIVGIPVVAPAPRAAKAKAKAGKPPSVATQRKQLLDGKTIPELRLMLRKNDQITTGNKSKLVKRILECVEHGGLPRCPQCGLGRLKVSKPAGFRCPGGYDDDEYVFCGFTAGFDELERPAWQFETPGGLV